MIMQSRWTLLLAWSLSAFCSGPAAPPWVKQLPDFPGRIYAVGTATVAPNEAKALE